MQVTQESLDTVKSRISDNIRTAQAWPRGNKHRSDALSTAYGLASALQILGFYTREQLDAIVTLVLEEQ